MVGGDAHVRDVTTAEMQQAMQKMSQKKPG